MRTPKEIAEDLDDANLDAWRIEHLVAMARSADDHFELDVQETALVLELVEEMAERMNKRVGGLAAEVNRLGDVDVPAPIEKPKKAVRR